MIILSCSLHFISYLLKTSITIFCFMMAMIPVVRQRHIVPYWLLSLLCTYSLLTQLSKSSQWHFVTQLIHRDSIYSPYYNPNYTIYDRAELERTSSMARFAWMNSRETESVMKDSQAKVLPEHLGLSFMARMSFGEPPVPQIVSMDTGSSLLWIQSLPCIKCFDQLEQIFDPAKSSTYINIPCGSAECASLPLHSCDRSNNCVYTVSYVDRTTSIGPLVYEQLTIGTSDEGLTKIPKVITGCGHENTIEVSDGHKPEISGVLGLGPRSESLVHKLGKKFSYCVGSINDLSYPFNHLAMGEAARLEGYSTPMSIGANQQYLVTLEGISVGGKRLGVTRKAFQGRRNVRAGVILDSGTTYTYLASQWYFPLKNEVEALMDGLIEQVPVEKDGLDLCYNGDVVRDLKGFPVTTFHLAGGANLAVEVDGMFRQVSKDIFCMAVSEASAGELSLIGILAQQYYNVGYDLDGKRIYFQRIDCELLLT